MSTCSGILSRPCSSSALHDGGVNHLSNHPLATIPYSLSPAHADRSYRLTWQSKVGPKAWQGPQTAAALEGLAKRNKKDICLVPIAFTSDHIETLYELDRELKEDADKLGVTLTRAGSLNDSPIFIRALADIVSNHLREYDAGECGAASKQLMLRCPGCTNPRCARTKNWLEKGGREAEN